MIHDREVMQFAIRVFGAENQEKMLLEEMSELQKEVCKHWRGRDNLDAIAEEIADVEIMLEQAKLIFGNAERVEEQKKRKLWRLREIATDQWVANAEGWVVPQNAKRGTTPAEAKG